ncbi:hypothetical protein A28LD_0303 [Idiomarina sp. A28L]|uniref:DUF4426 domain-containing protein n=1 Tax=Idiomarina sp. A28L TaxID=1036674 RepID=UPI0002138974|nr:DUF4426 domain-containing protein [Idiomarina sp. A28L]EGN76223.1 hypothetical protein A28LD_0303 [Idiomarina sp. A28L]
MNILKGLALTVICAGTMLLSTSTSAQETGQEQVQGGQYQNFGNWQVHYSAFPSTMLQPEVATRYNIRRSNARGLVNISVLDTAREDNPAQRVAIQGYALNSLGQRINLQFRRFVEEPAIYYISEVGHDNDDRLRFFITITQGDRNEELRFTHTFYR